MFNSKFIWFDIWDQFRYIFVHFINYNDLLIFWKNELIVLNLFFRRWEVTQCAQIFDRVTRQLFRAERQRANVFYTIRRILQCWLSDDCYDVEIFEILLKKNFENQQRMFDFLQLNFRSENCCYNHDNLRRLFFRVLELQRDWHSTFRQW